MLRTKFFAQTRPTQPAQPAAPAGLRAIDPADFKFIAGGAPRGGWTSSVRHDDLWQYRHDGTGACCA